MLLDLILPNRNNYRKHEGDHHSEKGDGRCLPPPVEKAFITDWEGTVEANIQECFEYVDMGHLVLTGPVSVNGEVHYHFRPVNWYPTRIDDYFK